MIKYFLIGAGGALLGVGVCFVVFYAVFKDTFR